MLGLNIITLTAVRSRKTNCGEGFRSLVVVLEDRKSEGGCQHHAFKERRDWGDSCERCLGERISRTWPLI